MECWMKFKEMVKAFGEKNWTLGEKVLLLTDCVLLGIVIGAAWSPKRYRSSVIGSYNCGNGAETADEDEDVE
jgi:hypothetical protein